MVLFAYHKNMILISEVFGFLVNEYFKPEWQKKKTSVMLLKTWLTVLMKGKPDSHI